MRSTQIWVYRSQLWARPSRKSEGRQAAVGTGRLVSQKVQQIPQMKQGRTAAPGTLRQWELTQDQLEGYQVINVLQKLPLPERWARKRNHCKRPWERQACVG